MEFPCINWLKEQRLYIRSRASTMEEPRSHTKAEVEIGELPIERTTAVVEIPEDVHSVYTTFQKKMIVLTASTAALFSPLSSNIYLPALNLLAADMHVTDAQINFTVTSYLVGASVLLSEPTDSYRSFKQSRQ